LLRIDLGGVVANCHFFSSDEIECDLDPKEVRTARDHDKVLGFVVGLAHAVNGEVQITDENQPERTWVRYQSLSGATGLLGQW
jgi:hypothetical protein